MMRRWIPAVFCIVLITVFLVEGCSRDPRKAAIRKQIKELQQFDRGRRGKAMEALVAIGPDAVPEVRECMNSTEEDIRERAGVVLGRIGVAALPTLQDALQSEQREIRAAGVKGLGEMGEAAAPAIPKLIELLFRRDTAYVQTALVAIGAPSVPLLMDALKNNEKYTRDPVVGTEPAWVLEKMGPVAIEAIPDLLVMLESGDRFDRSCALLVLPSIGKDALPQIREARQDAADASEF